MAMRPMTTPRRTITRADATIVALLLTLAVMLVVLAQVLGLSLLG